MAEQTTFDPSEFQLYMGFRIENNELDIRVLLSTGEDPDEETQKQLVHLTKAIQFLCNNGIERLWETGTLVNRLSKEDGSYLAELLTFNDIRRMIGLEKATKTNEELVKAGAHLKLATVGGARVDEYEAWFADVEEPSGGEPLPQTDDTAD